MAAELTVTAKGQVAPRKAVLDHLGVKPEQKIAVSLLSEAGPRMLSRGGDLADGVIQLAAERAKCARLVTC